MRHKLLLAAAVFLAGSLSARADTSLFSVYAIQAGYNPSGLQTFTVTFAVPSMPVPESYDQYAFTLNNVAVTINGVTAVESILFTDFYASVNSGGPEPFNIFPCAAFSGTTAQPIFLPISGCGGRGSSIGNVETIANLTITNVPSSPTLAPEPSSFVLLATGLLGFAGSTLKRRFA